ncbi:MAG: methylated-DNA--[protein]-cysteine S-methyltransferase [Clostridia bacterium]|jgi:methylated-DNA-[protein]-cysteine S-methyltransferase|nr:methylated-DNA--[protein]-cysteine S-methyltransferase [Clostridia bacterium]
MKYLFFYQFPIGTIGIGETEGCISDIIFSEKDTPPEYEIKETPVILESKKQLEEYFAGTRKCFDLPIKFTKGTDFQKKIWETLLKIPYGETCSYKKIAEMAGHPKASRAVGGANNKNPISIIVPCHRVIGANGSLVGYGGGLNIKEALLNLEKGR